MKLNDDDDDDDDDGLHKTAPAHTELVGVQIVHVVQNCMAAFGIHADCRLVFTLYINNPQSRIIRIRVGLSGLVHAST